MNTFTQTISNAINEIIPHFDEVEKATEQDIQLLATRISMTNYLLLAVLDNVNQDVYFWQKIDRPLFAETMEKNKVLIQDMRTIVQAESHLWALLDNIQENIAKLEKSLAEYPQFNFDLARMKERLNDTFHECPRNLQTVSDFRSWLEGISDEH